ncbi:MAG: prolyl oligopeptidase family serine peptidase [Rhodospirillales bacterium]
MPYLAALLAAFAGLAVVSSGAAACGPDSDCVIGDRIYRIDMPQGHDGVTPVGALVYSHGHRGTAAGVMANLSLRKTASDLGLALIATKSSGTGWSLPGAPSWSPDTSVDELPYFDQLIDDVTARFPIDRKRLIATGFSAGGMMVWTLACHRSDMFAAFVPMSGTFWRPVPETCTTPPAHILHIHGDADKTVPLAGRKIRETQQGDVHEVLSMYAAYGQYGDKSPFAFDQMTCEEQQSPTGKTLAFCLFQGGHSFRSETMNLVVERLRAIGAI